MKPILVLNAVIEGLAGIILILRPDLLLYPILPGYEVLALSRLYGIAALTMGVFSWIVSKNFEYTLMYRHFVLMILAFHLMVSFHTYSMYKQGITGNPGAFVSHIIILIVFGLIYLKNSSKFTA